MKGLKKTISIVAIVLVALIVLLVAGFYVFGEGMIKTAVEKAASETLGVAVTIEDIDLSILGGRFAIKGLVVSNPEGYANETLLELGEGSVVASIGSLMGEPVRISEIKLNGVQLTMEQKGLTNNVQEIIKRLPAEEEQAAEEKGKDLQVDQLEMSDINVKVKLLPVPGKADTVSLALDPIKMNDLGTKNKLSIPLLVSKIMAALATGITRQGAGVLPDDMLNAMDTTLKQSLELGKAATQEGQKLLETTGEAGKDVIEGFKGLLQPKKEQ